MDFPACFSMLTVGLRRKLLKSSKGPPGLSFVCWPRQLVMTLTAYTLKVEKVSCLIGIVIDLQKMMHFGGRRDPPRHRKAKLA